MKVVKAYRCEFCGKLFLRKNNCEEHEKNDCSKIPKNRALCYECKHYQIACENEVEDIELDDEECFLFAKRMQTNKCRINNDLMFNPLHMRDYVCDALIGAGWQYMPTVENGCKNYKYFKDE